MKWPILLTLSLLLLSACAETRYAWEHESGLGGAQLQEDQNVCSLYADEQTPPMYYAGYPYYYDRHHFYGGPRQHFYGYHSYPHYGYWGDYGGYNVYAYQKDISRACMKGKGWNRIKVETG
jgi:hypothetical protein